MNINKAIKTVERMMDRLDEKIPLMPLEHPARTHMVAESNALELAAVALRQWQFEIHKGMGSNG